MKTENENAAKLVRSDDLLDAGSVTASDIRYVVTIPHNHKTLKSGDVVVMTETPMRHNLLIRISDMTLHRLTDEYDQYVHLSESSNPSHHDGAAPAPSVDGVVQPPN